MTLQEMIERYPNAVVRLTLANGELDIPVSAILEFKPNVYNIGSMASESSDETLWTLTVSDD